MKLLLKAERLRLLSHSIRKKNAKEKDSHYELHAVIKTELLQLVNEWTKVSKPENVISSETKELLAKLEDSIYLTFKTYQDDQNNGSGQEQDS